MLGAGCWVLCGNVPSKLLFCTVHFLSVVDIIRVIISFTEMVHPPNPTSIFIVLYCTTLLYSISHPMAKSHGQSDSLGTAIACPAWKIQPRRGKKVNQQGEFAFIILCRRAARIFFISWDF